jgi:hypothetical protein
MLSGIDEGNYRVYGVSLAMQTAIQKAFLDLDSGKYTILQVVSNILADDTLDLDEKNLAPFEFGRLYERRKQCVR